MNREDAIKILGDLQPTIQQRFKATVKGIFGSVARNQQTRESDLDVLVDFQPGADLIDFVGLSNFLEEQLHCKVDVVPADSLRKEIKEDVLKEAIFL